MESGYCQSPFALNLKVVRKLVECSFTETGAVTLFLSVFLALFFILKTLLGECFNITFFVLSSPPPLALHIFIKLTLWHYLTPFLLWFLFGRLRLAEITTLWLPIFIINRIWYKAKLL